jgi:hypothetical protein
MKLFGCDFDFTRSTVVPNTASFNIYAETEKQAVRKLITAAFNKLPEPTNYSCEINIWEIDTTPRQQSLI